MQSTDAIRYYVKGAFQGVKETPEVLEQEEEIVANLSAKVDDLVSEGKPEAEALGIALASIGDLSVLAEQFEPDGPKPIPTATVHAAKLDFHVAVITVGLGGILMLLSVVLGALTRTIYPEAAIPLLMTLTAATWWIGSTWKTFRQTPEDSAVHQLAYGARFRKALVVWAAMCFAVFAVNMISGTGFWFWPFWVAATAWVLHTWVERTLVVKGLFVVTEKATVSPAERHLTAIGDRALA